MGKNNHFAQTNEHLRSLRNALENLKLVFHIMEVFLRVLPACLSKICNVICPVIKTDEDGDLFRSCVGGNSRGLSYKTSAFYECIVASDFYTNS